MKIVAAICVVLFLVLVAALAVVAADDEVRRRMRPLPSLTDPGTNRFIAESGTGSNRVSTLIIINNSATSGTVVKAIPLTTEEARSLNLEDLIFVRRRAWSKVQPPAPAGAIIVVPHPEPPPAMPNATNRPYTPLLRRSE